MAAPAREAMRSRARAIGLPVTLALATLLLVAVTQRHYPIARWLFWRYAGYWLACALLTTACLSLGHRLVRALVPTPLPLGEQLSYDFAVGCLAFVLGLFAGGELGLYGPLFFFAWPLAMIAAGARPLLRYARRALHGRRRLRAPASAGSPLLLAFGAVALAILYGGILVPDNVAYDARWYHLAIAEHYAAQGAIRPFVEGWYFGAYPHLASLLYTWAFLLPGGVLFDRVELAAHVELTLFLWTLAAIPTVVRRLLPGTRAPLAWVALLLFPGIFLYDSSLSGAADHVAAFWALPIALAFWRALPRLQPRPCALLALLLAGALLTKYQAVYLLAGPALALLARALWLAGRTRRLGWLAGPAVSLAVGLVATAPHWLKNWIYYRDPVYPYLHLATHPLQVDPGWAPVGSVAQRALETAGAMTTFSFVPHDWDAFHGAVPVFGSLFTLGLLALPWLRAPRRLWGLAAMTQLGVLVWFVTFHQDRYLQILLPWMAAVTAAIFILVWRSGRASRIALAALIAAQLIWGGDVPFLPTHAMLRAAPLTRAIELMSSGYRQQLATRLTALAPFSNVAPTLPPHAKVLVHDLHTKLGLGAMTVSDAFGWQGELDYARLGSPRAAYARLRDWGVTHLLWEPGRAPSHGLADDLVFFGLALRHASAPARFGFLAVAPLAASWRDDPLADAVLQLGCAATPAPGIYAVGDLTRATRPLGAGEDPALLLPLVGAAVIETKCARTVGPLLQRDFVLAAQHGPRALWIRQPGR